MSFSQTSVSLTLWLLQCTEPNCLPVAEGIQDLSLPFLALDKRKERLVAKDMKTSYQNTSYAKEKNKVLFYILSTGKNNFKIKKKTMIINYLDGLQIININ